MHCEPSLAHRSVELRSTVDTDREVGSLFTLSGWIFSERIENDIRAVAGSTIAVSWSAPELLLIDGDAKVKGMLAMNLMLFAPHSRFLMVMTMSIWSMHRAHTL